MQQPSDSTSRGMDAARKGRAGTSDNEKRFKIGNNAAHFETRYSPVAQEGNA